MKGNRATRTPSAPARATPAVTPWDDLVRRLMVERFGPSPYRRPSIYPPVVPAGTEFSTNTQGSARESGEQVHPESTSRTPRRSR